MKYSIEQQLIASSPELPSTDFVARTMQAVKTSALPETFDADKRIRNTNIMEQLFMKLKTLPTSALTALIITGAIALGGVVYASVQFLPGLIKIVGTSTNQRGATEYDVPSFAACVPKGVAETKRFERKKDAPKLSDEEIRKIIQARCELEWVNQFVSSTWPTYGTHKEWQDGDDIFYARPDILGKLISVSAQEIIISSAGKYSYAAAPNQSIAGYADGSSVALQSIKPGDTVFTVVRVAETYHQKMTPTTSNEPRPLGAIGLLKLSLPLDYYQIMQSYITELPKCHGNDNEYCPNTASIDVFPREGGEGAHNPQLAPQANAVLHEISGTITTIDASTLTLTSRSGKKYTVSAPKDAFAQYNQKYAIAYTDVDAKVRLGSTVSVTYFQTPKEDSQTITANQIMTVRLLIDALNVKKDAIRQY